MTTRLLVAKILIEYSCNILVEINEEKKETTDIEWNKQEDGSKNDENAIDLRLSVLQEEDDKDIAKVIFSESLQKLVDERKFIKILLEICMIITVSYPKRKNFRRFISK